MPELPIALMRIVAALETKPGLERWDSAAEACDEGMLELCERRFWAERNERPVTEKEQIDKECWLVELVRTNLRLFNRAGALAAAHRALRAIEFEQANATLPEDTGAWHVDPSEISSPAAG